MTDKKPSNMTARMKDTIRKMNSGWQLTIENWSPSQTQSHYVLKHSTDLYAHNIYVDGSTWKALLDRDLLKFQWVNRKPCYTFTKYGQRIADAMLEARGKSE